MKKTNNQYNQTAASVPKSDYESKISFQTRAFASFIRKGHPRVSETFSRLANRADAVANGTKEQKYDFYLSFADIFKDGRGSLKEMNFNPDEQTKLNELKTAVEAALDQYYPNKWK